MILGFGLNISVSSQMMNSEETSKLKDLMDSPSSSKNSGDYRFSRGRMQRVSTFSTGKTRDGQIISDKKVATDSKLIDQKNNCRAF